MVDTRGGGSRRRAKAKARSAAEKETPLPVLAVPVSISKRKIKRGGAKPTVAVAPTPPPATPIPPLAEDALPSPAKGKKKKKRTSQHRASDTGIVTEETAPAKPEPVEQLPSVTTRAGGKKRKASAVVVESAAPSESERTPQKRKIDAKATASDGVNQQTPTRLTRATAALVAASTTAIADAPAAAPAPEKKKKKRSKRTHSKAGKAAKGMATATSNDAEREEENMDDPPLKTPVKSKIVSLLKVKGSVAPPVMTNEEQEEGVEADENIQEEAHDVVQSTVQHSAAEPADEEAPDAGKNEDQDDVGPFATVTSDMETNEMEEITGGHDEDASNEELTEHTDELRVKDDDDKDEIASVQEIDENPQTTTVDETEELESVAEELESGVTEEIESEVEEIASGVDGVESEVEEIESEAESIEDHMPGSGGEADGVETREQSDAEDELADGIDHYGEYNDAFESDGAVEEETEETNQHLPQSDEGDFSDEDEGQDNLQYENNSEDTESQQSDEGAYSDRGEEHAHYLLQVAHPQWRPSSNADNEVIILSSSASEDEADEDYGSDDAGPYAEEDTEEDENEDDRGGMMELQDEESGESDEGDDDEQQESDPLHRGSGYPHIDMLEEDNATEESEADEASADEAITMPVPQYFFTQHYEVQSPTAAPPSQSESGEYVDSENEATDSDEDITEQESELLFEATPETATQPESPISQPPPVAATPTATQSPTPTAVVDEVPLSPIAPPMWSSVTPSKQLLESVLANSPTTNLASLSQAAFEMPIRQLKRPRDSSWGPSFGVQESTTERATAEAIDISPLSSWFFSNGPANFKKRVMIPRPREHVTTSVLSPRPSKKAKIATENEGSSPTAIEPPVSRVELFVQGLLEQSAWRSWYAPCEPSQLLDPPLPTAMLRRIGGEAAVASFSSASCTSDPTSISDAIEYAVPTTKKGALAALEQSIREEKEKAKAFDQQLLELLHGKTLSGKNLAEEYAHLLPSAAK